MADKEQKKTIVKDDDQEKRVRDALHLVLTELRTNRQNYGQSPQGRATNVAITQFELASMAVIRSFYADEEYSPLLKLEPVKK